MSAELDAPAVAVDPLDVRRALGVAGLLGAFNAAGVLAAADVHVARRLGALAGEDDESVRLATALAVRATRLGHVCVDLATIAQTAAVDVEAGVDLAALDWPEPAGWTARVAASPLVAADDGEPAPLRLEGSALYLDRYWREEREVAADLRALGAQEAPGVDAAVLAAGVQRLFGEAADGRQARAAATAVRRRLAVVAGGPGTGKTTAVAQIVALLLEQADAAGAPAPLIALAAPTGKAAARLDEAVRHEAGRLDVAPPVRERLAALGASTLHRLLGWRPGSHSRFRHHRANRLPHDVVIVDETSMVSLSLMARLVEAVRTEARLVLVGDPGQLTSIEAGAVLGDVVGPAVEASAPPPGAAIADGIVVLDRVHRYGEGIARLAEAIRAGDADATLAALREAPEGVRWLEADAADPAAAPVLEPVRAAAVAAGRAVHAAARAGDGAAALDALGAFRLLCAHRRGPYGAATWMGHVEGWLAAGVDGFSATGEWYVGRPLLVAENDYALRLYNGDTGVVIAHGDDVLAAFPRAGALFEVHPSRLGAVETVHAMTVHKSQGSQFGTAAVVLPDPTSRLLTRELLYTAVTRARDHVLLVGTEEAVRTAVQRPAARASGLRARLWGPGA
ncbi:MAG TPA: exodeoxyribonuclease V subunit alpha [Capillimicrobium sp.]|nr:exodeoxyribonuclease V subunit alpha [Capillimicrobium sp.]